MYTCFFLFFKCGYEKILNCTRGSPWWLALYFYGMRLCYSSPLHADSIVPGFLPNVLPCLSQLTCSSGVSSSITLQEILSGSSLAPLPYWLTTIINPLAQSWARPQHLSALIIPMSVLLLDCELKHLRTAFVLFTSISLAYSTVSGTKERLHYIC